MIAILLVFVIFTILVYAHKDYYTTKENERLKIDLRTLMAQTPKMGETVPMSHFRQITSEKDVTINTLSQSLSSVEKSLAELKSQQQSKSVRLGNLTETILPMHLEFPYDYKLLRPMFQPIDYLYFGEDKIVFLEVKMGTSQLSEKQKKIRSLIREGKVYFEEHRVDEQGYKIK